MTFGAILDKGKIPPTCCKAQDLYCSEEEAKTAKVKGCQEFITESTYENMKMVMYIWIGAIVLQVGTDAIKKNNLSNTGIIKNICICFFILGNPHNICFPCHLFMKKIIFRKTFLTFLLFLIKISAE